MPGPPKPTAPFPTSPFSALTADVSAGLVVFLVALPLCLGVALASGAPLASGLIAGCIGGIVIPWISRAELAVSGPARSEERRVGKECRL